MVKEAEMILQHTAAQRPLPPRTTWFLRLLSSSLGHHLYRHHHHQPLHSCEGAVSRLYRAGTRNQEPGTGNRPADKQSTRRILRTDSSGSEAARGTPERVRCSDLPLDRSKDIVAASRELDDPRRSEANSTQLGSRTRSQTPGGAAPRDSPRAAPTTAISPTRVASNNHFTKK